jgi:hypothetical protein
MSNREYVGIVIVISFVVIALCAFTGVRFHTTRRLKTKITPELTSMEEVPGA